MAKQMVFVEAVEVGRAFACVGIVRCVGTGRKLAEADDVRPYGFDGAARADAERLAEQRGWTVAS